MSSNLSSFVPVLDGTNYQQWAAQMQSYLMAQGQWPCVINSAPKKMKVETTEEDGEGTTKTYETIDNQEEIDKWIENNMKAVGNIRLRLHHTIQYQFNGQDHAHKLWEDLKAQYGQPGISKIYLEYKGASEVRIPDNQDPSPAIDKFLAHITRLRDADFEIPTKVQVMMLLAKCPPYMDSVVITVSSLTTKELDKVDTIANVIKGMLLAWESKGRRGQGSGQNRQQANKLSAVQRGNDQAPQFQQQQQQQRGEGSGRGGRGRRGKRGGKNRNQQQLEQAPAEHQQQAPPPPQQQNPQPPPPTFQFSPSSSGHFFAGSLVSPPTHQLPPPPHTSVYPAFADAVNLGRALEVPSTTENLRNLEITAMIARNPRKRSRTNYDHLRGKAQGLEARIQPAARSTKGKEVDDEVVSLGGEDDEEVDYGDGPLTTLDFAEDDNATFEDYGDMAHDERAADMDLCWQVPSTTSQDYTDEQTELDSIAVCTNISSFPCLDKCECVRATLHPTVPPTW